MGALPLRTLTQKRCGIAPMRLPTPCKCSGASGRLSNTGQMRISLRQSSVSQCASSSCKYPGNWQACDYHLVMQDFATLKCQTCLGSQHLQVVRCTSFCHCLGCPGGNEGVNCECVAVSKLLLVRGCVAIRADLKCGPQMW